MNDDVGFGIIGCGTIARVHATALATIPNVSVKAVASRREAAARTLAETIGCDALSDHHALLARPDIKVVCITTSSGSHAALALAALAAGKHVVVEKPMAMTSADARRMIETARACDLHLSVIFQRRFESHHQAVRQAVASGALGRILLAEVACPFYRDQAYYDSADWRGTLTEDGGALMNQAIHSVDLLLWLCGPATRVVARTATQTHRMEAEDLALVIVDLQAGGYATIMASTSIKPGFTATLNLYGERGTIKLAGPDIVHWSVPDRAAPAPPAGSAIAVATHLLASHEQHRAQLADLVAALRCGGAPVVTGADGFASVALVEAAYASAAQGQPVEIASLVAEH